MAQPDYCPIGETFYKGGDEDFPFLVADVNAATGDATYTIVPESLTLENGGNSSAQISFNQSGDSIETLLVSFTYNTISYQINTYQCIFTPNNVSGASSSFQVYVQGVTALFDIIGSDVGTLTLPLLESYSIEYFVDYVNNNGHVIINGNRTDFILTTSFSPTFFNFSNITTRVGSFVLDSISYTGQGLPYLCGSLLAFTSEPLSGAYSVGDTVSLSCSVEGAYLEGGGCEIGSKFFEGGTEEFPFSLDQFNVPNGITINPDGSASFDSAGGYSYLEGATPITSGDIPPIETRMIQTISLNNVDIIQMRASGYAYMFWLRNYVSGDRSGYVFAATGGSTPSTACHEEWYNVPVEISIIVRDYSVTATISGGGITEVITDTIQQSLEGFSDISYRTNAGLTAYRTFVESATQPNDCTGKEPLIVYNLFKSGDFTGQTKTTSELSHTFTIEDAQISDSGTYSISVDDTTTEITSRDAIVLVTEESDPIIGKEIDQGDPKMFITAEGMSLSFVNGMVVRDGGLENMATISLGTSLGYSLNSVASNGGESVGSGFEVEAQKSITRDQISIIEDEAVRAFDWAIQDGLIKSVTASMAYVDDRGYEVTIVITPPTGENRILVYGKNGENWVQQQNGSNL